MKKNTQDQLLLEFREDSVSNIIYEESDKFGSSISNEAYYKAFQITKVILSVNNQYRNKGKKGGTAMRNNGQFFNIVAFTGDRGTGKTSAMLSYMEFLKDYYRKWNSEDMERQLGNLRFENLKNSKDANFMFTGLEYIDASMLGARNDDVLRNVLPKMLKKWHDEEKCSYKDRGIVRDEDYAYKKRKIQMLFNNVYKSLRDLNSKQDILESDNDMFMETLENLSLTWNLRQSFQELVEAYLEIMKYPSSEGKIGLGNHFLVISLDDLDMNMEHGFELLEEIRKYLMVPNVIVLLSASYDQLERLCIEHYMKAFKKSKGEAGTKEYIINLSREYLEKILPVYCQVQMEPIQKWRSYDKEEIKIEYTRIDERKCEIKSGTLKKIIQKQYIDYFDLKFSADGKCLRYLMPSTLRELALWIRELYSLDALGINLENLRAGINNEDNVNWNAVYKTNLQWFWREKLSRIYEKYLGQHGRILETLDQLGPDGRILTIREALGRDREERKSLLELLGINVMKTEEKQILSALSIIYLSAKLTEAFAEWYDGENEAQRAKALDEIRQYFSDGIWGTWEEKMMCQGIGQVVNSIYCIARVENFAMNRCLDHLFNGTYMVSNTTSKETFVRHNQQAFKNYQLLLMFFDFSADFNFSKANLISEQGNSRLELGEDKYRGSFALSNIMRPWEKKERVIQNFLDNFLRMLGTNKEDKLGKKVLGMIDIRGQNNNCILMPLENIESLIDIGQKLEKQLGNRIINMEAEEIRANIKEYFSVIHNCLEEYDCMYGTSYREEFEKNQIGIELQNSASKPQNTLDTDLLYMLSESISRIAVPKIVNMID